MPTLDLRTLMEWACADCDAVWQAAREMRCSSCGSHDVEPVPTDDDRQAVDDDVEVDDDEETS